ncbi:MAG: hypothetical protein AB7S75_14000 [Desulfococcaceae bacterium]
MQTITVKSEHIKLPPDVFSKLKGKEIRFVESPDGFFIEPVFIKLSSSSKLANLKIRKLIRGNADELPNIKVGEWNELKNL